jgi:hypothetical protein
MTTREEKKQRQFDRLTRKLAAGTITRWEYLRRARLYYELHPEKVYWTDGRTPAQIWGTWTVIWRGTLRLWSRFREEIICFAVSYVIIAILIVLLCLSHLSR